MTEASQRMAIYDQLTPPERELVDEFSFAIAYPVIRELYGRWALAREVLENIREELQVKRWKNIT